MLSLITKNWWMVVLRGVFAILFGLMAGALVTIPLTIKQAGPSVTLEITPVKASYSGTLNSAGTELAGTYTQAGATIPVTFQRAAPAR